MKWILKISYSWGEEESSLEFNNSEEAWETAKKYAFKEVQTASCEYGNEDANCEIGIIIDEKKGHIDLHYMHDDTHCYYDVVSQEIMNTDCVKQSEKTDTNKISMEGGYLVIDNSLDPDYPGVDIEFVPNDEEEILYTRPRIVIEKPKGEKLWCLINLLRITQIRLFLSNIFSLY